MEELSIEEKAKRYDEAIRKAKITLGCCNSASIITKHTIYDVFPELEESEDEKIRKAIINKIKSLDEEEAKEGYSFYADDYTADDCIAWLEKQGEQNLVDKVEPEFHVGEWVVFNNRHGSVYQVEKIENYEYTLRHFLGGSMPLSFSNQYMIRAWTIQDAKEGDVLTGSYGTFIFLGKSGGYCGILNDYTFIRSTGNNEWTKGLHPATKEQRDVLIKAMADAGWEFDFQKKELNWTLSKKENTECTLLQ